ncbi:MAG: hypothetical protein ACYC8T_21030 [Myxococcaceae bacterium]
MGGKNLETVYLFSDPERGLVATDWGETFRYLRRGTDKTYVPADSLSLPEVAKRCQQHGTILRERSEELPACIERVVASNESLAPIVASVAEAIGAVFEFALASGAGPRG